MRRYFLHTLPGRAIVIGLAIKLAVWILSAALGGTPAFLGVIDTVAGLAVAIGLAYFAFQLLVLAKRRMLWRVRRKLILSYIFIGFVPAILIATFFVLCGLLLFFNFSSYLLQAQLRSLEDGARFVATTTALEIQRSNGRDVAAIAARKQSSASAEYDSASIAIVPVDRSCPTPAAGPQGTQGSLPRNGVSPSKAVALGPWTHIAPPTDVPSWIGCEGFSGLLAYSHNRGTATNEPRAEQSPPISLNGNATPPADPNEDTHMLVRSVAFPESPNPGFAVVVDLLVTDQVKQRLRDTGVELRSVSSVPIGDRREAKPLRGRDGGDTESRSKAASGPLVWITFLDFRDWLSGQTGTLVASTQLSIGEIYDRIAAAQGAINNRPFGQAVLLLLLFIVGGLFLIIEVVALVVGFALAKSITGSVHELFTGTERVRQGDFTHKIAVKAQDQLGELAESFNEMTGSIEDLLRQAAEKKRLEEELRIAHEIQMSLLPQGPLLMAGLSVTALCVPAREVGGDYYDFLPLDDYRVGVLIADVSGKGTSAALYMAELKGLMLSLCRIHSSPRELLVAANRIIADHLDARSFITMTYAIIDLRARTMTYARAGHTPLIYVPGGGIDARRAQILAPDGMVLGLKIDNGEMFERLLEEQTIPLHPGDLYLFFTDGISEAMNAFDDCFGETRLGQLAENHADLPSDELRERVLREISAFVGAAPQHDDMTMILLKVDEVAAAVA